MGQGLKALVTGGAGFIGSHLAEALIDESCEVRVLDNLATGYRRNLAHLEGRFEWIEGDSSDFETCLKAVEGVDTVFHQAAIPSVPRSIKEPLFSHRNGDLAALTMLEASRTAGVRRFIFAASSSAYGNIPTLPKREEMIPVPLSPYAAGKLAGEHYVRVYAQTMGLDGASLRYFNIFGPRQDPSSQYSGVISRFAEAMLAGKRPTIFGDGRQTRDFTYVSNAVSANLLAMRSSQPLKGEVYNVGTGTQISLLELAQAINEILGIRLEPEHQPERAGDVRHSLACLAKIEADLGYRTIVPFHEGLSRTLASFSK